jgi:hypothetical protein
MWKRSVAAASIVAGLLAITGAAIAAGGSDGVGSSTDSLPVTTMKSAPGSTLPSTAVVETMVFDAGDAGTVTVTRNGDDLAIMDVDTNEGWEFEIEQAIGPEVEVKFLAGDVRVDFEAEFGDGDVRARVRTRVLSEDSPTSTTSTTLEEASSPSLAMGTRVIDLGAAGTITVDVTSSGLRLVSVDASAGWTESEIEASPSEIEVELESEGFELEVKIELEDGELEVEIEHETEDDSDEDHHEPDDDDDDEDDDHASEDDEEDVNLDD